MFAVAGKEIALEAFFRPRELHRELDRVVRRADLAVDVVFGTVLVGIVRPAHGTVVADLQHQFAGAAAVVVEFVLAVEIARLKLLADDQLFRLLRRRLRQRLEEQVQLRLADRLDVGSCRRPRRSAGRRPAPRAPPGPCRG